MRSAAALMVCAALSLVGCTGWEKSRGIDPVLDPAAVTAASNNHILILTALARDANISVSNPDWHLVAEAGFNYVDDQCRLYFNHLFFLNREREQIKSGIIASAATTAAILGVTGASVTSMAVVAQAFGLGAVATDLIAGTYLYHLPPATTQGFVNEMQLAYREGAALAEINTPTAAYHVIQSYLALCLPPTIEAKIGERVATTRAFPDLPRRGAAVGITLANPPPLSRPSLQRAAGVESPARSTRVVHRPDDCSDRLEKYLDPNGSGLRDADRVKQITPFLTRNAIELRRLTLFLNGPQYATQRCDLVGELGLR